MRYETNEQRRRTLFKPTLWAVASWLIFRVAHSLGIDRDRLVVRALKINQLTDGGIPLSCDSMHSLYISTWKPCFKLIKRLRTTIEGQVRNDHGGLDRDLEGARSLGAASGH